MTLPPYPPRVTIGLGGCDPTQAINAFLWAMANARALGFMPKTEHALAEHLFREDAKVIYYSSVSGITSIVEGQNQWQDEASEDDLMEVIQIMAKSRRRRRLAMKEALAKQVADEEVPVEELPEATAEPL